MEISIITLYLFSLDNQELILSRIQTASSDKKKYIYAYMLIIHMVRD